MESGRHDLAGMLAGSVAAAATSRTVVLVEGPSDRVAVETLAARRGRDLDADRVAVLAIGGATNIARFLGALKPHGPNLAVAGLCDEGEERYFQRALERAGYGRVRDRDDMAALGFHVCVADLEDELIRALGTQAVEAVIASQGELGSLRLFQNQPAQRRRTVEEQLRRFMGTRSMRKIRYAGLLVDALDPDRVPRPLDGLLAQV